MHRRRFLARIPVTVVLTAGCVGQQTSQSGAKAPLASLRMTEVSDAEIAVKIQGTVSESESTRTRVLSDAISNKSMTVETLRPPIEDGDWTVFDGVLYEVSYTVVSTTDAAVYPITLNPLAYEGVTAGPDARSVRFDELPAVDQTVFREHGLADGEPMGIGTQLVYTDEQAARSALVPRPKYTVIVWEPDRRGRFSLRHDPVDRTLSTYRYTVERIATAPAYGKSVRENHVLNLSDIPDAEATILEQAIDTDDPYTVEREETPSSAFQSLTDRFRGARDVHTLREPEREDDEAAPSGQYLVRYDEATYWTSLYVDWATSTETTSG